MDNRSATFAGTLYVVATPIGNLQDITFRAVAILQSVDVILAEDTRHSGQLLKTLGIQKPMLSLHAHNEDVKSQQIVGELQQGKCFALISDAGTPLISDPGFLLIREARQKGIPVVPIPGACALIAALCVAGVPCDSFLFAGFLPAKQPARINKLQALCHSEMTAIIYESTHRLLDCLEDVMAVYGHEYCFVLAKEITKSFEEIRHGKGSDIKGWLLADKARIKGEFVLIFPPVPITAEPKPDIERMLGILLAELPLKQAVKLAGLLSGVSKNDLYKMALSLQG